MMWILLTLALAGDGIADKLLDAMTKDGPAVAASAFAKLRPEGPKAEDENALNGLGYRLLGQGKTDRALAVFKLNAALFPHKANPLDSLAECYMARGNAGEATRHYAAAFEKQPDRAIWRRLGQAHEALGDTDAWLAYARRGASRFDDREAHDVLLALRIRFERSKRPSRDFKKLAARFPGSYLWRSRYAMAQADLKASKIDDGWQIGDYESAGLDRAPFDRLLAAVAANRYQNLHGVVVVKGDAILAEAYFDGHTRHRPHDTRSVGKSVVSLLAGIAIDRDLLSLETRVYDAFPSFQAKADPKLVDALRAKHLLAMSSGYDAFDNREDSPGNENYYQANLKDWSAHVLGLPMAFEPGSRTVYASANYMLLGDLVAKSSGQTLEAFAREALFSPLDVGDAVWFHKPDGSAYGAGGIRLTPRDLAKLGRLVVASGRWRGRQVVSEAWIRLLSTPTGRKIWGQKDYAYGWYCHEESARGRTLAVVSAAGNGGQRIWAIPALDAVAVVTAGNYNSRKQAQSDEILRKYLLPSLTPARAAPD